MYIIRYIIDCNSHPNFYIYMFMVIADVLFYSTNVDVVFVLERLLLTMADKAGTKDLITKVNKAKSRQGGQLKAKSKRK